MDLIPQDVWPVIAKFMDNKTKQQIRLASMKWFNLIKYNNFVFYFTRSEDLQAIMDRLSTYDWPIKICFAKSKFNDPLDLINKLPKLTNLLEIKLIKSYMSPDNVTLGQWMQLSTLTKIEVWKLWEDHVPLELLQRFTKLKKWTRSGPEWELAPVLQRMSNLNSLRFFDTTRTWPFSLVPNPEKLTTLSMAIEERQEHGDQIWSRLTNLKQLHYYEDEGPVQNTLQLKYLTSLQKCTLCTKALRSPNPDLKDQTTNKWPNNTEAMKNMTNLKSLCLITSTELDFSQLSFLENLSGLQSLTINHDYGEMIQLERNICKYIPMNLKHLSLAIGVNLEDLTHLTNLVQLSLDQFSTNCEHLAKFKMVTSLEILHWSDQQDFRSIATLTQLEELYLANGSDIVKHPEDYAPDLSNLVHLKKLKLESIDCSHKLMNQITCLTKLEELGISPTQAGDIAANYKWLAEQTKLTSLRVNAPIDNESFWINLVQLTNMKRLSFVNIDNDDRMLQLIVFNNLTELEINAIPESFTGCHFTALTSLQAITLESGTAHLVYKKEDLIGIMPFLQCCYFGE